MPQPQHHNSPLSTSNTSDREPLLNLREYRSKITRKRSNRAGTLEARENHNKQRASTTGRPRIAGFIPTHSNTFCALQPAPRAGHSLWGSINGITKMHPTYAKQATSAGVKKREARIASPLLCRHPVHNLTPQASGMILPNTIEKPHSW